MGDSHETELRHNIKDCVNNQIRYSRRAPPPPVGSVEAATRCHSDNIIEAKKINVPKKCISLIHDSVASFQTFAQLLEILITKEVQHLIQLTSNIEDMEKLSTYTCRKMIYLRPLLELHDNNLKKFQVALNCVDIANVFILGKVQFQSYLSFTQNKKDFSYPVTDLGEEIVNKLKRRILEYNFVLSEMKELDSENIKTQTLCTEAGDILKRLFDEINEIEKLLEGEQNKYR